MMQDLQISPKLYAYSKLTRKPRSPKPCGQQQQDNRVVHSSHFWLIFGSIFRSFLSVWQKNDQNELKNDVKNDVKNGYCEQSETQTSGK
jgi:hypothetical protein